MAETMDGQETSGAPASGWNRDGAPPGRWRESSIPQGLRRSPEDLDDEGANQRQASPCLAPPSTENMDDAEATQGSELQPTVFISNAPCGRSPNPPTSLFDIVEEDIALKARKKREEPVLNYLQATEEQPTQTIEGTNTAHSHSAAPTPDHGRPGAFRQGGIAASSSEANDPAFTGQNPTEVTTIGEEAVAEEDVGHSPPLIEAYTVQESDRQPDETPSPSLVEAVAVDVTDHHSQTKRRARWVLALVVATGATIAISVAVSRGSRNGNSDSLFAANREEAFMNDVGIRVLDALDAFFAQATDATTEVLQQFPQGLHVSDRDAILASFFSLLTGNSNFLGMYYASEEGMSLGYMFFPDSTKNGVYREPGNSYLISDPAMQKYLHACVNRTTGEPKDCTYEGGGGFLDFFIACIDNCSLALCPDGLTLCPQYSVRNFTSHDEVSHLGFIPRTHYCITEEGIFSQEPGMILQQDGSLGDCHYWDGKTTVNRSLPGEYGCCQGQVCEIFEGGYQSSQSDPRFRNWYIHARERQEPSWTPIYELPTNSQGFVLGISYAAPVHVEDQDSDRPIFHGVVLVDILLSDLTGFLQEPHSIYSDITLAAQGVSLYIYESEEPNYLIANSTGTVSRVPASEAKSDLVFSTAYALGYALEPVNFEVLEGANAGEYLALSVEFTLQEGIYWTCLVILRLV